MFLRSYKWAIMTDPIETKEKIISQRRSETSFLADTNFLFEGELVWKISFFL